MSPPTAPKQGDASATKVSSVYNVIMTPVIFVSFLVSLVWVDFRYSLMRSHNHSDDTSQMPRWLHTILYREAPYQYVRVDRSKPESSATTDQKEVWYHTKQRKLMEMEAEDAFRIRGSVLVVLGMLAVAFSWLAWRAIWLLWALVAT